MDIGQIVSPTEAAIGDPIRAVRAKLTLLVEEAVPVQVVAGIDVVGEVLALQVIVAALLAGGEAGDRGEVVLGQTLALSRVATPVPCSGCCQHCNHDNREHCCYLKP